MTVPILLRSAFLLAITLLTAAGMTRAQGTRGIRDSVGFCWDARQMSRFVRFLDSLDARTPRHPSPIAAISPHDDYLYAGRVYHPLFRDLRTREVVIFGVTHGTVRRAIGDPRNILLLEDHGSWTGPYGPVSCSPLREWILQRMDESMVRIDRRAHQLEHSIEALIPFLQHHNRDIRITPIMVTAASFDSLNLLATRLAAVIADYISANNLQPGADISFLISCDANHYGRDFGNSPWGEHQAAHAMGTREDLNIIDECMTGILDTERLRSLATRLSAAYWCGRYSVPFGLLTVTNLFSALELGDCAGTLYRYSDTCSEGVLPIHDTGMGTTAPFSFQHWVGFFSAGFSPR